MECSLDCSQVCYLECSQTCSLECSVGVLFRPYSCQQLTAYGYREFMNQRSANVTSCFFLAHNNHKNLDQFQNWIDHWYIAGLVASTNNGVSGSRILGIKGPLLTYNSTSWRMIPRSNAKSSPDTHKIFNYSICWLFTFSSGNNKVTIIWWCFEIPFIVRSCCDITPSDLKSPLHLNELPLVWGPFNRINI